MPEFRSSLLRDNARLIRKYGDDVAAFRSEVLPHGTRLDVTCTGAEYGTWAEPYNTMQEGVDQVPYARTLIFKPGSEGWTGLLNKSMTLMAHQGAIVIDE